MENPLSELTGKVGAGDGRGQDASAAASRCAWRGKARGSPIHYGGSEAEARKTAAECGGAPIFQANLEKRGGDRAHVRRAWPSSAGRLDGLVNNAARFTRSRPLEITEARLGFHPLTSI